ncbi:unnamed protein product [Amaranthus hypochondriacus]
MGGKTDNTVNQGRGTYNFRLGGQNYHRIGRLVPNDGNPGKFQQLYIVDTENEISNRKQAFSSRNHEDYKDDIVENLKNMLDVHNQYVKIYNG